MKLYNKHIILNPHKDQSAMGNIKCFYGEAFWDKKKIECVFAISDCHTIARIHTTGKSKGDTKRFIKKLRLIAKSATKFADWLEKNI